MLKIPIGALIGGIASRFSYVSMGVIQNGGNKYKKVISKTVQGFVLLQARFNGKGNRAEAIEIIAEEDKPG